MDLNGHVMYCVSKKDKNNKWFEICNPYAHDNRAAASYRFLTSVAQPSIPSPLLKTGMSRWTSSMPMVPCRNSWLLIPPALALFSGRSSSIGVRKSAILLASSTLKWYFSRKTSGKAQCLNRWILRSSPFLLKISWDHFPARHRDLGKVPRSSMICAM